MKIKIAKKQKGAQQFLDNYTMDFQNLTHTDTMHFCFLRKNKKGRELDSFGFISLYYVSVVFFFFGGTLEKLIYWNCKANMRFQREKAKKLIGTGGHGPPRFYIPNIYMRI